MTTQIVRVGNTLTVEIPEELVAKSSLPIGEPVEWVFDGKGSISLVKPSTSVVDLRKRIPMEELLEGVEENSPIPEFDWGGPVGVEVW